MCNEGSKLDFLYGYYDAWNITETSQTIEGYTTMNNFSMGEYLDINYQKSIDSELVSIIDDRILWILDVSERKRIERKKKLKRILNEKN